MSRIRYGVAMSLDGYIAGPRGEFDWIVREPAIDFAEIWSQFDTLLMGRGTYEPAATQIGKDMLHAGGMKVVVVSRTMKAAEHPDITLISQLDRKRVGELREGSRKDIWLFGGGVLFREMLALREVDAVEVSVIPVLLGDGIRMLPSPAEEARLQLTRHTVYPSGIVSLAYDVQY